MISVIIPCYNYGRYLGESIDSALAQAGPGLDVEVIVVDDGSSDHTREVAASYGERIRYLYQENQGISAARNTGIAAASHAFVAFLDADDCFVPNALAQLAEVWSSLDPKPGLLASRHIETDEFCEKLIAPEPIVDGKTIKITAKQLVICNRFCPTVLANGKNLLILGGFDTGLTASEDRDLWIRVAAKWEVVLVNLVSIRKRNHGMNLSRWAGNQTAMIERVLEKAFTNNEIALSWFDKRYALAVFHYQSALMFADAGEHTLALARMVRSILSYPIADRKQDSISSFSRIRGIASLIRKLIMKIITAKDEN